MVPPGRHRPFHWGYARTCSGSFGLCESEAAVNTDAVTPFQAFLPAKTRNRRPNDAFFPVIMTSISR
jgi:hypothetical protein